MTPWQLRYAPHLGYRPPFEPLFRASVGSDDPLSHIAFAHEQGFSGVLYAAARSRPVDEQRRVGEALARRGMEAGCMLYTTFDQLRSTLWTHDTPEAREQIARELDEATETARRIGARRLAVLGGADPARPLAPQQAVFARNLRYAADRVARAGLLLCLETLSSKSVPDMLLQHMVDAQAVARAADHPAVRLIFDTSHVQIMDGDLLHHLESSWDAIEIVQLADNPGRAEPGSGEIHFESVLRLLHRKGYRGLVELEHGWSRPGLTAEQRGLAHLRCLDAAATRPHDEPASFHAPDKDTLTMKNDTDLLAPAAARIRDQVRSLGADFDAKALVATRAIYTPHLDLSEADGESPDVSYGPHPRHRLDLYRPAGRCRGVVVFVHGGGFVGGDKNSDGVFYPNIGRWFARQGFLAVLPNYRLAPGYAWPCGAQDVGAAVHWARQHADEQMGSGTPLYLLGQSAGASHVASWLFDDRARDSAAEPGPVEAKLAGVMLMSGFYRANAPLPPGPQAYFGDNATLYETRSPLTHVKALDTPLWLSLAELDPGWIAEQTYALAQAVTQANGRGPAFRFFAGHNHVSTVQSLGSPQREVGDALLDFMQG